MAMLLLLPAAEIHAFPVDQCAADRSASSLNCNAKDVQLTNMRVVGDTRSCTGGDTVSLDLEVTVNFGQPKRYDIGVFISNDGKDPWTLASLGGAQSCNVTVLPTTSPFYELDGDQCGDGEGNLSGIHYIPNVTVPCQSAPGVAGKLYLPFVVSWDHQSDSYCGSNADVSPGTGSKCSSPIDDMTIGTVNVVVLPAITIDDGIDFISSGDTTDYTVIISNDTSATLSDVLFKDPAVTGLTANSLTCTASGGATCPAGATVADMQGDGITLPDMPDGGSLAFTINATLSGNHNDTITNTVSVSTGGQTNYASDTNTIRVGDLALSPSTSSKTGAKGLSVTHEFTLYNFGEEQEISLSATSSQGWSVALSPTSVTLAEDGTAIVTATVSIPANATVGTVDTTVITAQAGSNTATASAVTTVGERLTFTPDNAGAGGRGASVYYNHRVQNNWSQQQTVTFSAAYSGACTDWTSGVYASDKVTPLSTVSLAPLGGYEDVVVKVTVPAGAQTGDVCAVTTTADAGGSTSAQVTDTTTVKNLILYADAGYTKESYIYPAGNEVYGKAFGLTPNKYYLYVWKDPSGTTMRTSPETLENGPYPDTYAIPESGPLGKWTVEVRECTGNGNNRCNTTAFFADAEFYVGPDHIEANYAGSDPMVSSNVVVDLALHDKWGHDVPTAGGTLVKGNPPTTKDPLMVTVTVSGSATIVDDGTGRWSISGQSATGRLDDTTGTATITITNNNAETVTITPYSYDSALYGSPSRDEPATVTFTAPAVDHYRIVSSSGVGLTCTPSTLTIKACTNSDCTSLYTGGASGTLTASGTPTVNWIGGSSFTIPTGFSSVEKEVQITTPGTVLFGTQSGSLSPIPAGSSPICDFAGDSSCAFTALEAGLLFSVPNHTAETVQSITVSAVKKADDSLACVPAFANRINVPVTFQCGYLNPGSGTVPVRMGVGNTNTALADDASSACSGTGATLSLDFDDSGVAQNVQLVYADAGEMSLIGTHVGSAESEGLTMIGVDTFVSKPASFALTIPGNPAATDAYGVAFKKAGETFQVLVEAHNAAGSITPNYGKETAAESVMLMQSLVGPLDCDGNPANGPDCHNPALEGAFGDFATDCAGNAAVAGTACGMFSWAEVGIIRLTPSVADGDYLGAGDVSGSAADYVGRFVADHFDVALSPASFDPANTSFTYLGQPFRYAVAPSLSVTAKSASPGNETLANYQGDYWKLGTQIQEAAVGADSSFQYSDNVGGGDSSLSAPASPLAFGDIATVAGSVTLSVHGTGEFSYSRPATEIAPFDADVTLQLNIQDSDLASGSASLASFGFTGDSDTGSGDLNTTNDRMLRYGRAVLSDTYGSSVSGTMLPLPLSLQYYDGTDFIRNVDDLDTTFNTTHLGCSDLNADDSLDCTITATGAEVGNGDAYGLVANGERGNLVYVLDISTAAPFLQFDWAGTGTATNPRATATFGIYRGDDRFLFWREIARP